GDPRPAGGMEEGDRREGLPEALRAGGGEPEAPARRRRPGPSAPRRPEAEGLHRLGLLLGEGDLLAALPPRLPRGLPPDRADDGVPRRRGPPPLVSRPR